MASAILLDPEIVTAERDRDLDRRRWLRRARRSYPGIEFNLSNDIAAANVVFDSGITIWQVPSSVYSMVSVGYAELEEKIGGAGPARRVPDPAAARVERHLPPGADRVAVPGRLAGRLADALPPGRDVPDRPAPRGSARRATTCPDRDTRSGSASRSTSGSCSRTCSPRSASSPAKPSHHPSTPSTPPRHRRRNVGQTKETDMTGRSYTRRGFLGLSAAAVAGAGLSACTGAAPAGAGAQCADDERASRLHLRR